ncbi:MAG: translocation/assembly module TamB domain-containing protein [Desulfovibrio sp.]|nr:translocation/assembly module TamB domain-containing protein [Desulfovibrio sp.]
MEEEHSQNATRPVRKPLWRRILRFLLMGLLILLGLLVLGGTGLYYWLGTESGLAFVQKQVNQQAGPVLAQSGLALKLQHLSGQLPRHFVADLVLADASGDFLHLPETRFALHLSFFPMRVEISELCLKNAVLERLPVLPASPPSPAEPSPPLTPKALRELLRTSLEPLFTLPEQLPSIHIAQTGVENFSLPKTLLGFPAKLTALCDLTFSCQEQGLPKLRLALTRLSLESSELAFDGNVLWESGTSRESWLAGQLAMTFTARADPQAFLAPQTAAESLASEQKSEAHVNLTLNGPLFSPQFSFAFALGQIALNGQSLSDCSLTLQSQSLDFDNFLQAKADNPLRLALALQGKFNGEPVQTSLGLWARLATENSFEKVLCGVQDLDLQALGLAAKGEVSADLGQARPQLTGNLACAISDWKALAAFVPGQQLAGQVQSHLTLSLGQDGSQNLDLHLDVPNFSLSQPQGEPLRLDNVHLKAALFDLFARQELFATLEAASLALGPQKLSLKSELKGTAENLALRLSSQGDLRSELSLRYAPGRVDLEKLELFANAKAFTGNDANLGLQLKKAAAVQFSPNRLEVSGVDLALLPKGRLTAQGSLAPEQYALQLAVQDVDLAAWQTLLKELPKGRVELRADLAGSAKNPRGSFKVGLTGLVLPKVRLQPLDLALLGNLSASQGLAIHLEMPQKTVQALGGEKMALTLSLPLQFSQTGLPAPAENGKLSGQVFWQGKLAPLWKLSPLSDRKLSGDLLCDIALAGSLKAPSLKGSLNLGKARFEDPLLGVLLRDIGLNVAIDGKSAANGGLAGQLKLTGGLGDGMGGTLKLDGSADLTGEHFRVQTKLDHLRPLRREDVRISLSGEILAQGKPQAPDIGGVIIVDNGAVQLESIAEGPKGVTTLPIGEKTEKKPEAKASAQGGDSGRLHLAIRSPGRFLVDGFGLNTEWKTDLTITGPLTEPVIAGEVSALKGNLDFLNKNFVLEKGEIILGGGNVANPLLDILLTNTTADFTSHVRISGTVKKMKLSLTSEPEMPQDDVLAHILFGRNANELGRYEALQLAAATARMASGLGRGLNNPRKALGMDVMRLKSNSRSSSGSGMENMAVETGKYLNDSIYVGVEQGAGEGSTAGTVQLEITPRLKLELRSQGNNTQGSLNWKYNY